MVCKDGCSCEDCCKSVGRAVIELWNEQSSWSQSTFGKDDERGPAGPLKHLGMEVGECIAAIGKEEFPDEIADIVLLLFDSARRGAVPLEDMIAAAGHKLEQNKLRQWGTAEDGQPIEHVRDVADGTRGDGICVSDRAGGSVYDVDTITGVTGGCYDCDGIDLYVDNPNSLRRFAYALLGVAAAMDEDNAKVATAMEAGVTFEVVCHADDRGVRIKPPEVIGVNMQFADAVALMQSVNPGRNASVYCEQNGWMLVQWSLTALPVLFFDQLRNTREIPGVSL